ncbi:MAG: hypothetical protein PF689_10000 [Deltaproteobacteria bacterium]|jgi:lipopolysaccharide export LptBFGC system permease protein LptF|nr:hypothetical protein [Deltaproteobacteria bacterium]
MKVIKYPILFIIFLIISCSKPATKTPRDVLHLYKKAIKNNDPRLAYSLLDKETQTKIPFSFFKKRWEKYKKELVYQAALLDKSSVKQRVSINFENNTRIEMVTEKDKWKVKESPGLSPSPATPQQLIAGMVKSLERLDMSTYISYLSPAYRQKYMADIRKKLEYLKKAQERLENRKQEVGEEIEVNLNPKISIILRKQGKVWRVESWQYKNK